MKKCIVKKQFDKQAENFSNWSVTRNVEYLKGCFDFWEIGPQDKVLDVACGTGEFSLYCADKVAGIYGIDLAQKTIELARKQAVTQGLNNASFESADIEELSLDQKDFSIVVNRSAFHHFVDYDKIFQNMAKHSAANGFIGIQDIIAQENADADEFFEEFEKAVDKSHNKTLPREFFIELYQRNGVKLIKTTEIDLELNVSEYIAHAVRDAKSEKYIKQLIHYGTSDEIISKYFANNDNELFFKRKVMLLLGKVQ